MYVHKLKTLLIIEANVYICFIHGFVRLFLDTNTSSKYFRFIIEDSEVQERES